MLTALAHFVVYFVVLVVVAALVLYVLDRERPRFHQTARLAVFVIAILIVSALVLNFTVPLLD